MQVWADFLDMLRDKGEVVDFQTARKQIESSLVDKHSSRLQAADTQEPINALISKGLTMDELLLTINNN